MNFRTETADAALVPSIPLPSIPLPLIPLPPIPLPPIPLPQPLHPQPLHPRPLHPGLLLLGALASLGTMACDAPPPTDRTIRTDSAGISIATATRPLWGPGEGWTVGPEPLVEIGTLDGAPEYQFAKVVAATRLSTGEIVVADQDAFELRSYSAQGGFQWSAGRFGEGPGEFESLDYLGRMAGDTLVAWDSSLMRVQLFEPGGRVVRGFRVALGDEGDEEWAVADKAVGVVDGFFVVRFIDYGEESPSGIVRWPGERLGTVDLADGSVRSLMVVPGGEASVSWGEGDRYSHGWYVFAKGPEYGAAAGRIAIIDTEAWSVRLASPGDGAIHAILRRDVAPIEVTPGLFDLHLDGMEAIAFPDPDAADPDDVARLRRMWRERPRASTLPLLRAVHLDATGHIWLVPYYVAGAEPPPFEIHAPDGSWLGSVTAPPGLERAFVQYQAPYMEIGEDYLLGVWVDDLGLQYVRVYGIER